MALSKSSCPVTSRYYHRYVSSPWSYLWRRYRFSDPYWTRYHTEFETMRTSMLVQQDLIDEMLAELRTSRASRVEQSSRISSCAAKCDSISRSLREDSRSIPTIESEMASWQRAVSDMHSTMSSLKSKTETMGNKIESLKNDFDATSRTLKTEFNIESLLAEMEAKRKRAEEECQRIYDSLNLSKPKVLDSWKSKTTKYLLIVDEEPEPVYIEPVVRPVDVCSICGSENCTYGSAPTPEPEPTPEVCEICGAENCTYGDTPTAPTAPVVEVCDVCFKENCPYFVSGSF